MRLPVALSAACIIVLSTYCHAFTRPAQNNFHRYVTFPKTKMFPLLNGSRRPTEDDDHYFDDGDDDDDDNEYYYEQPKPRRRRRRRKPPRDDLGSNPNNSPNNNWSLNLPSPFGNSQSTLRLPTAVSNSLLAGIFVLGVGTGVTVDSQINTNPKDLASRDAVDRAAPNPKLCTTYGASAMAFDQRVFVSFNPFNVFVAQADVKPACVLRTANVVPVLQDKGLIDGKEVRECKSKMNTWAFVGDLEDYPQLSCVYQSQDAQNEFLSNPKYGIGEDIYDNDREKVLEAVLKKSAGSTAKQVKSGMTEGEKAELAKKAAALNIGKDLEDANGKFSLQM